MVNNQLIIGNFPQGGGLTRIIKREKLADKKIPLLELNWKELRIIPCSHFNYTEPSQRHDCVFDQDFGER